MFVFRGWQSIPLVEPSATSFFSFQSKIKSANVLQYYDDNCCNCNTHILMTSVIEAVVTAARFGNEQTIRQRDSRLECMKLTLEMQVAT
jgi:hypothetical protein